jgi:hypothetical protein
MQKNLNGYNKPIREQVDILIQILLQSEKLNQVLNVIPHLELPNWYLGAGCINQTVWNYLTGKELSSGIKDFDLIYYDDHDISWEKEDEYIQKGKHLFKDIPFEVEIRNQARVHLWYEQKYGKKIEKYISSEEAIASWLTTITCIGIRKDASGTVVFAPFGLNDLFGMVIRANKVNVSKEYFETKAARWKQNWPELVIIPWDQT